MAPQWSPLSTSGATTSHTRQPFVKYSCRNGARSRRAGRPIRCLGRYTTNAWAAMEPALDERGDHAPDRTASPPSVAAMEPALDERGDHFCPGRWHRTGKPQWSPLSTSGATGRRCRWPPRFDCRNGARSRRAGRRASQVGGCDLGEDAAMEPALDERGDDELRHAGRIDLVPQWSPLSTSGATGNTVRPAGPDARAAMEPALDERGDQAPTTHSAACTKPQWSPLSTSGATSPRPTIAAPSATLPQWSPLSTSGATWLVLP